MELGLIGLGKMGGNMRERIRQAGHTVIGYDRNPDLADVGSLKELVDTLAAPRAVWVMVPAGGPTQSTVDELAELLSPGDLVIDGGNSQAGPTTRSTPRSWPPRASASSTPASPAASGAWRTATR